MSFVSAVVSQSVSASPVIISIVRFGLCRYVLKVGRTLIGYYVYIRVGINSYLPQLPCAVKTLHVSSWLTLNMHTSSKKNNEKEQRTVQKVDTWQMIEKCWGIRISTYRDILFVW